MSLKKRTSIYPPRHRKSSGYRPIRAGCGRFWLTFWTTRSSTHRTAEKWRSKLLRPDRKWSFYSRIPESEFQQMTCHEYGIGYIGEIKADHNGDWVSA